MKSKKKERNRNRSEPGLFMTPSLANFTYSKQVGGATKWCVLLLATSMSDLAANVKSWGRQSSHGSVAEKRSISDSKMLVRIEGIHRYSRFLLEKN